MKVKEVLLTSLEKENIIIVEEICCPVGGEGDTCVLKSSDNRYYLSSPGHSFEMICKISEEFYNIFKKEFTNCEFIQISKWRGEDY